MPVACLAEACCLASHPLHQCCRGDCPAQAHECGFLGVSVGTQTASQGSIASPSLCICLLPTLAAEPVYSVGCAVSPCVKQDMIVLLGSQTHAYRGQSIQWSCHHGYSLVSISSAASVSDNYHLARQQSPQPFDHLSSSILCLFQHLFVCVPLVCLSVTLVM